VRYGELREVTNAVWVVEALNDLGYNVTSENVHVKAALDVFLRILLFLLSYELGR
jgi:hypothetical protein